MASGSEPAKIFLNLTQNYPKLCLHIPCFDDFRGRAPLTPPLNPPMVW